MTEFEFLKEEMDKKYNEKLKVLRYENLKLKRIIKQIIEICTVYRNMHAITLEDYARREVALKVLDKLEIEKVND